ncbi:MAG: hypothetical protein IKB16_05740 [Lentisphaeria bacterium]|nr:hypothetical protein [Lentisphaeria bacterium]
MPSDRIIPANKTCFSGLEIENSSPDVITADLAPDQLRLAVQPDEGFYLSLQAKHPGPKLCLGTLEMDFRYSSLLPAGENMPSAYERLLLDIMLHDRTLFMRRDTVELSWQLFDPVLHQWAARDPTGGPLLFYPQGTPGPQERYHFLQTR